MKRYKCTNCSHILEIEEEKDKTIFGTLLKIGAWGVVAVAALHFLALVLMACLILTMDSVFDSNEASEKKATCKNCGKADFEKLEEE